MHDVSASYLGQINSPRIIFYTFIIMTWIASPPKVAREDTCFADHRNVSARKCKNKEKTKNMRCLCDGIYA